MKTILFLFLYFTFVNAESLIEYDYEIDAYYSNVSAFIDLDRDSEIIDGSSKSESEIYKGLFSNIFHPNVFLIEAAIHPMPLLGLAFRKNNEELYQKAKVQDFNIVKAITVGFEEPYSFSAFIGRMLVFKNKERDHIGKNRAYIGCLVSYGNYSIKDNKAYRDDWVELEFKLKGTREKKEKDLDWSFRVGGKVHINKDFVNSIYIGVRRKSIDYKKSVYSFLYNSAFSTSVEFSADTLNLMSSGILIEKIYPLSWSEKMSFSLGIGYMYNSGEKYRGTLKEEAIDKHQLILRPNLKF